MKVRGAAATGSGPHGVVVDATGSRAWVTDTYNETVSVIDLDHLALVATTPVGRAPNGISYSSRPPASASAATITLQLPPAGAEDDTQQPPPHPHGH